MAGGAEGGLGRGVRPREARLRVRGGGWAKGPRRWGRGTEGRGWWGLRESVAEAEGLRGRGRGAEGGWGQGPLGGRGGVRPRG